MACLCRSYLFEFFKGCLLQILFGPFLNISSHLVPLQISNSVTRDINFSVWSTSIAFPTISKIFALSDHTWRKKNDYIFQIMLPFWNSRSVINTLPTIYNWAFIGKQLTAKNSVVGVWQDPITPLSVNSFTFAMKSSGTFRIQSNIYDEAASINPS